MVGAVVFGSDQGLVGQFNDLAVANAAKTLATVPGKARVWAVGQRVHARLAAAGLAPTGVFDVPSSVEAIAPLVGQILVETRGAPRPGSPHGSVSLLQSVRTGSGLRAGE